jgi:hypothetical protein
MANQNPNQDPKQEMSDNKQALIRNCIAIHWNDKFNSDNPIKKPMKLIKHNDIAELLVAIGKNDELMPQLQKIVNYKSIGLRSYTKEMLEILEPHFSIEGMELDIETRQLMLVEVYGEWYRKEFPYDKKKNYTINNTSVADLINYMYFQGIESIPNLYKLGIKNIKNYKPKNFDTKALEQFEILFKQVDKTA